MADDEGLRERLTRSSEDALGKLAQDLLTNPVVGNALSRAFEAREKAVQAQEVAFNALNLPSAADVERLTRRVRNVSQRLEGIEDGVDRLDERLAAAARSPVQDTLQGLEESVAKRLDGLDEQLRALTREVHALRDALPDAQPPVPASQERLAVGADQLTAEPAEPAAKPKPKRRSTSGARKKAS